MAYNIPYSTNYGAWYGNPENVTNLLATMEQTIDEYGEVVGQITASWSMPDSGGTFNVLISEDDVTYTLEVIGATNNTANFNVDANKSYYIKVVTVLGNLQSSGTVSSLVSISAIPTPSAPALTVVTGGMLIDVGIIPMGYTVEITISDGTNTEVIDTAEQLTTYMCNGGSYSVTTAYVNVAGSVGTSSSPSTATISNSIAQGSSDYVKDASVSGDTLTITKGNNSTVTFQGAVYSDFIGSGANARNGLVPQPPTTAGNTKYLCEDGTWATPSGGGGGGSGGVTVTNIFTSASGVSSGDITLIDNWNNYDFISVTVWTGQSTYAKGQSFWSKDFLEELKTNSYRFINIRYSTSFVTIQPTSDYNKFTITENGGNAKVYSIDGYKSGGGSGIQSVTEGSTNGTISVDGTDVSVHGLGSAAYTSDTDYVKTTTAQTVGGAKTFTTSPQYRASSLVKGNNPSSVTYPLWSNIWGGGTGTAAKDRFGAIWSSVTANGNVNTALYAYKNVADSTDYAELRVTYPKSGTPYAIAPTPDSTVTDNEITTASWVNTKLGNYLPLTGGTLTGDLTISKSTPNFIAKRTSVTRGTIPASSLGGSIFRINDSADNILGSVFSVFGQSGVIGTHLYAYGHDGTSGNIGINVDSSGNVYTYAPTPSATDDSTKIATTAWVRGLTGTPFRLDKNGDGSISTNDDLNDYTTEGTYICGSASTAASLSNCPYTDSNFKLIVTKSADKYYQQWLIPSAQTAIFIRYCSNNTFGQWAKTVTTRGSSTIIGGSLSYQNTSLTKGTNPASTTYPFWSSIFDKNGTATANRLGAYTVYVTPAGSVYNALYAYQYTSGSTSGKSVNFINPLSGDSSFRAGSDNNTLLGDSSYRWKEIFCASATINTSDERLKSNITDIPNEVLDAWGECNFQQFQFKESIAEKGESARIHTGLIAQRIKSVFESHGLDAFRYGLLCYDEWEAEDESRDDEGNVVTEAKPAGNRYSLRYEEALCMESAYQRRRADRLEERIARLESVINGLR